MKGKTDINTLRDFLLLFTQRKFVIIIVLLGPHFFFFSFQLMKTHQKKMRAIQQFVVFLPSYLYKIFFISLGKNKNLQPPKLLSIKLLKIFY